MKPFDIERIKNLIDSSQNLEYFDLSIGQNAFFSNYCMEILCERIVQHKQIKKVRIKVGKSNELKIEIVN